MEENLTKTALSDSAFKQKTTNNLKIACWSNHFEQVQGALFNWFYLIQRHLIYTNFYENNFETSISKACQLIQPERDPETKRQNEKIVTNMIKQHRLEYTSSVCFRDKFDKMLQ